MNRPRTQRPRNDSAVDNMVASFNSSALKSLREGKTLPYSAFI